VSNVLTVKHDAVQLIGRMTTMHIKHTRAVTRRHSAVCLKRRQQKKRN